MEDPLRRVIILGGGIAGLTVAQELAERGGFDIHIYEKLSECGGEIRSMLSPDGYPGEHSVHNLAYVYYQLKDTLSRVPIGGGKTLLDNVVTAPAGSRAFFYYEKRDPVTVLRFLPLNKKHLQEFKAYKKALMEIFPKKEIKVFIWNLFKILCMCDERRINKLENKSWKEFFDEMGLKSENAQKYLFRLPEFFIASAETGSANAESMSVLTARILLASVVYPIASQTTTSSFFNGPSSETFINPWVAYLQKLGVKFHLNSEVVEIKTTQNSINGVEISRDGYKELVTSDNYVFALPFEELEILSKKNPEIIKIIPSLSNLDKLRSTGAAGIQFFDADENENKFPGGWMLFMDSPWSIAGVYQSKRLWPDYKFKQPISGVLSLVISSFNNPGILYNKPASQCTAEEMKNEILAQMQTHREANIFIDQMKIHSWMIDPYVIFDKETGIFKATTGKLFMRTPGCRNFQPNAVTEAENVFIAGDYIRTSSDSPSMESANEAGRRAANGILKRYHKKPLCFVLQSNPGITFIKMLDSILYKLTK